MCANDRRSHAFFDRFLIYATNEHFPATTPGSRRRSYSCILLSILIAASQLISRARFATSPDANGVLTLSQAMVSSRCLEQGRGYTQIYRARGQHSKSRFNFPMSTRLAHS